MLAALTADSFLYLLPMVHVDDGHLQDSVCRTQKLLRPQTACTD